MNIPDKLKLNKFRLVTIPKPREYVVMHGLSPIKGEYANANDILGGRKGEEINAMLDYQERKQAEQERNTADYLNNK